MRGRFRFPSRTVVVLVALGLRLGWVLVKGPGALQYSDDARAYNDLAINLVVHHGFVTAIDAPHSLNLPYAQRPPLTPFLLAGVYAIFGPHLLAAQIVLAIIGACSALLVLELGRHLFGQSVALLAGLLTAVYPFFVFLSVVPLTENLGIVLYSLLVLLLLRNRVRSSLPLSVAIGCTLGVATLDRPQLLGFLPFLCVLAFVNQEGRWTRRIGWLALTTGCWAVVIAPWIIRNRVVVGGWSPISLQGGLALYGGNNPYTQTAINGLNTGLNGWYDDPRMLAAVGGLSPAETDHKALRLGLAFITRHPIQSASYSMQKVGIFFSAYSNWIARLSWYPVLVLSLLGFYLTKKRWRELLPLYFLILQTMLVAAAFTSMPRFRAPVEPLFILTGAYAAYSGWTFWAKHGSDVGVGASSAAEMEH